MSGKHETNELDKVVTFTPDLSVASAHVVGLSNVVDFEVWTLCMLLLKPVPCRSIIHGIFL